MKEHWFNVFVTEHGRYFRGPEHQTRFEARQEGETPFLLRPIYRVRVIPKAPRP